MRQPLSELLAGAGILLRGFATWSRDPRLMLLGAVPALLVGLVMLGVLILLAFQVGGWATALTPFADGWDRLWSDVLRTALALGLLAGAVVLCVLTFAAITLAVGEPFYERISRSVDARLGAVNEAPDLGFWPSVGKGLRDAVVLIGMAIGTALVVFLVGLVPLIGSVLEYRHDAWTTQEVTDVSIPNFSVVPISGNANYRLNDAAFRPGCDGGIIVGGETNTNRGLVFEFAVDGQVSCGGVL